MEWACSTYAMMCYLPQLHQTIPLINQKRIIDIAAASIWSYCPGTPVDYLFHCDHPTASTSAAFTTGVWDFNGKYFDCFKIRTPMIRCAGALATTA